MVIIEGKVRGNKGKVRGNEGKVRGKGGKVRVINIKMGREGLGFK